jgi:hypothetical protein
LSVSRCSRHSHDDDRSSRLPHHTLLRSAHAAAAQPVRPHAAVPKVVAPWRPPSPFTRRVHRPAMASALRAAASDPEPANGPGEDQQHDDSGHDPRTTRACPLGSSSAPSDRSARRGFVPMIGCALSAYISDAPRGGEREGSAAARRRRATRGLCDGSLQVGGGRAVEQERRPTPSVHPDTGVILCPG